jgi:hypothetical protein
VPNQSDRAVFEYVCVCVQDGVYGITKDAARLKETMLQRQRRHGRGGMP